jgi:MoxR-like ATPase
MFAEINVNGSIKVVALNTAGLNPAKITRSLIAGQAVELADSAGLDPAGKINLSQVASRLRSLINCVSAQFVGRDELVEAFTVGLVANEHTFVLGAPGTAKTAVASALTRGIGGNLWRVLMNQDTTKEGLIGMIDPVALQAGRWTRKWAGIATCDVAVVDEVWKSSGQNANILLDVLEERKVREGDDEHAAPLVSALGMSNEIPEDSERQAIYDRFLIRLTVKYMADSQSFERMLTAAAGQTPIQPAASPDELRLLAAAAELLALDPPADVMNTLKSLWKELGQNGRSVSDRRWRKTLKLAAAYSLLRGEPFAAPHLAVAKWTLWSEPDEEAEIRNLVLAKVDPAIAEVLNCEALLASLQEQAGKVNGTDMQAKAGVLGNIGKLINKVEALKATASAQPHLDRLDAVVDQATQLNMTIIRKVN